jgi:TIR domain
MPRPQRLVVSHATADQGFLNKLTSVFKEHHIPFWYSRAHIVGTQQWHDEIGVALRGFDWFLLVLMPAAVRSKWVKRELLYAF